MFLMAMPAPADVDLQLQQLMARVALQDRQALQALYRLVGGRLLAILQRMLGDRGTAEDVLQDTFLTVWTRAAQFPQLRTSPMAWLTTIARHRAIDLMRKRKPETPLHWTDADGQPRQHDLADERASPLQQLMDLQADNQLQQCMATLDDAPRQAITLAYAEGLTHDQLALRLGRPLGTIKAWIRRSLLRLRDCLGEAA